MAVRPIDGNDFMRRLMLNTKIGFYGDFMDGSSVAFTFREIDAFVNDMPTIAPPTEWISIEDRLPEECADILLCRKILKIPEIGTYRQARFWVYDEIGEVYQVDDITHWMPIPTPYDIDHIHISEPPDGKKGWDKDGKSRRGTKL